MCNVEKMRKGLLNAAMSLVIPLAIYVFFVILTSGSFGGYMAVRTVARQSVIPLLIAMAMSFDMKQGTWDFSAGSVVYAAAIVGGNLGMRFGIPGIFIGCMLTAVILCTISGLIYVMLKIPAKVMSIGLLMVFEAFPRLFFKSGVAIRMNMAVLSQPPACFVVFLIAFLIYFAVCNYSVFGYNIAAIGANQEVAYNAGVRVNAVKFTTYLFKGFFLGIAGFMFLSSNIKVSTPDTLSSIQLIFDAMMGVFIAMFIGRFSGFPFGMIVGVFSMKMLTTAMVAVGMPATVRSIVNGFFLLVLLCISSNQGKVVDWKRRKKIGRKAEAAWKNP